MAEYLMTDIDINDLIPIYQARYGQEYMPYYLLDTHGQVIDCNTALLQLIDLTQECVMDRTLTDLGIRCIDSLSEKKTRQVFKKDGILTIRRRMLVSTASKSIVATAIEQVIVAPDSNIVGYVCHLEIPVKRGTPRTQLLRIVENEQPTEPAPMIETNGTSSHMSNGSSWNSELRHDLKNALANLKILSFLLQRNVTLEGEKYAERLESQINHLRDMILSATFVESETQPSRNIQNLNHVLQDVIAVHIDTAQSKSVDVVYINSHKHIRVDLDRNELYRLFSNLVSNAVKYTRVGEVIVVVRHDEVHSLVEVQVSDTGIGIPHSDQAHIFDPYYRSNHALDHSIEGTGIGLSIVRRIVTSAGGAISMRSQVDVGTTFTITLPCQSLE